VQKHPVACAIFALRTTLLKNRTLFCITDNRLMNMIALCGGAWTPQQRRPVDRIAFGAITD